MKKFTVSLFLVAVVFGGVWVVNGFALDFGTQLTISDGQTMAPSTWTGYKAGGEDQAVQWNDVTGQVWDLEGIFLKGSALTIVAGFDMKNGQPDPGYPTVYSGDIFIDLNGNMKYGKDATGLNSSQVYGLSSKDGYKTLSNVWDYDYVIHFDSTGLNATIGNTYSVYKLNQNSQLASVYYRQNDASGAYRYLSGGDLVGSGYLYGYQTQLTDAQTGFLGSNHNALTVDLGFLKASTNISVQYTMGCGNDDIIGKGTFVKPSDPMATPEPGTLILLGGGLVGLLGIVRKRMF